MTNEHKHAALLRMAADNEDQLFECDGLEGTWKIDTVSNCISYNWRPVKTTKKIKRWLWADRNGNMLKNLYSEQDILNFKLHESFTTKLLWSETIFEVEE